MCTKRKLQKHHQDGSLTMHLLMDQCHGSWWDRAFGTGPFYMATIYVHPAKTVLIVKKEKPDVAQVLLCGTEEK